MIDPPRILLIAAVLSTTALGTFAYQVGRTDPSAPGRLVGELRVAQWAALFLAAASALSMGFAMAATDGAILNVDLTLGVGFVGYAGLIMQSEPPTALLLAILGFAAQALVILAHRPGWLAPMVLPRWFAVGCAGYDVALAAICYWARRR